MKECITGYGWISKGRGTQTIKNGICEERTSNESPTTCPPSQVCDSIAAAHISQLCSHQQHYQQGCPPAGLLLNRCCRCYSDESPDQLGMYLPLSSLNYSCSCSCRRMELSPTEEKSLARKRSILKSNQRKKNQKTFVFVERLSRSLPSCQRQMKRDLVSSCFRSRHS